MARPGRRASAPRCPGRPGRRTRRSVRTGPARRSRPIAPTPSTPSYAAGYGVGGLRCRAGCRRRPRPPRPGERAYATAARTAGSSRVQHDARGSARRRRGRRPSGSPARSRPASTVRPESRPSTTCCSLTRTGRIRARGARPRKRDAGRRRGGDDARHAGAVPGAVPCSPSPPGSRRSVPARTRPAQLRMRPVDSGVEHRDDHAGAGGQRREPLGGVPLLGPGRAGVRGRPGARGIGAGRGPERGRGGRRPAMTRCGERRARDQGGPQQADRGGRDIDVLRIVSAPERDVSAWSAIRRTGTPACDCDLASTL